MPEDISQFDEIFIKNYNEESDERYFLEVDVPYPKVYIFKMIYLFCLKRMNIEKFEKFVAKLRDEKEYVVQTGNLKQTLNHRLVLKKVHNRFIKFNQIASLKPHIDILICILS